MKVEKMPAEEQYDAGSNGAGQSWPEGRYQITGLTFGSSPMTVQGFPTRKAALEEMCRIKAYSAALGIEGRIVVGPA